MKSRRTFLKLIPATLGACALAPHVFADTPAPAPAPVEESDPTATALGYKKDATTVDTKKYPQYQPGSACAGCALFGGKAGDATGICMALANRPVSAKGWCMAWAKKP